MKSLRKYGVSKKRNRRNRRMRKTIRSYNKKRKINQFGGGLNEDLDEFQTKFGLKGIRHKIMLTDRMLRDGSLSARQIAEIATDRAVFSSGIEPPGSAAECVQAIIDSGVVTFSGTNNYLHMWRPETLQKMLLPVQRPPPPNPTYFKRNKDYANLIIDELCRMYTEASSEEDFEKPDFNAIYSDLVNHGVFFSQESSDNGFNLCRDLNISVPILSTYTLNDWKRLIETMLTLLHPDEVNSIFYLFKSYVKYRGISSSLTLTFPRIPYHRRDLSHKAIATLITSTYEEYEQRRHIDGEEELGFNSYTPDEVARAIADRITPSLMSESRHRNYGVQVKGNHNIKELNPNWKNDTQKGSRSEYQSWKIFQDIIGKRIREMNTHKNVSFTGDSDKQPWLEYMGIDQIDFQAINLLLCVFKDNNSLLLDRVICLPAPYGTFTPPLRVRGLLQEDGIRQSIEQRLQVQRNKKGEIERSRQSQANRQSQLDDIMPLPILSAINSGSSVACLRMCCDWYKQKDGIPDYFYFACSSVPSIRKSVPRGPQYDPLELGKDAFIQVVMEQYPKFKCFDAVRAADDIPDDIDSKARREATAAEAAQAEFRQRASSGALDAMAADADAGPRARPAAPRARPAASSAHAAAQTEPQDEMVAVAARERLTPESLKNLTRQEVAELATRRAGIVPSAGCVQAMIRAGVSSLSYQQEWTREYLLSDLKDMPYFQNNPEDLDPIIDALLAMAAEAEGMVKILEHCSVRDVALAVQDIFHLSDDDTTDFQNLALDGKKILRMTEKELSAMLFKKYAKPEPLIDFIIWVKRGERLQL
jgi:hypothetical protein